MPSFADKLFFIMLCLVGSLDRLIDENKLLDCVHCALAKRALRYLGQAFTPDPDQCRSGFLYIRYVVWSHVLILPNAQARLNQMSPTVSVRI
jgi:hypothetical protein